jgi:hypothetical protein
MQNYLELSRTDGLVKSRKLNFSPQDVGHKIENATISCGQNKMLGLFTTPSKFGISLIVRCDRLLNRKMFTSSRGPSISSQNRRKGALLKHMENINAIRTGFLVCFTPERQEEPQHHKKYSYRGQQAARLIVLVVSALMRQTKCFFHPEEDQNPMEKYQCVKLILKSHFQWPVPPGFKPWRVRKNLLQRFEKSSMRLTIKVLLWILNISTSALTSCYNYTL